MPDCQQFTVDGSARFPALPPDAFPEAAGARLLTRAAAIRDGERRAVARATHAVDVPIDAASRTLLLAEAPTFVVSRTIVSDGGDEFRLVVTMRVAVDVSKLTARIHQFSPLDAEGSAGNASAQKEGASDVV